VDRQSSIAFCFTVNQQCYIFLFPPRRLDESLVEALGEGQNDLLQSALKILAQCTLFVNGGQKVALVALQVCKEVSFPLEDLVDWDAVEVTVDTSVDERNHLVDSHWGVLLLLEELGQLENDVLAAFH